MTHRARQVGAYTLVEVAVGAAVGLALLACVYGVVSFFARSSARTDAEVGSSLELTEFLEHLCQDLRDSDDMRFEEVQGCQTLRMLRGPRPGETSNAETAYELAGGGRRVVRQAPGGDRKTYEFEQAQAEADPMMAELSPDRRTLHLRGMGLRLQLPTPLGRLPETSVMAEAGAARAPAAGPGEEAPGSGATAAAGEAVAASEAGSASGATTSGARFAPAGAASGASAEPGAADGGLSRPIDASVQPGPDDPGLENVAGGQTVQMEGDAHVPGVVYRFAGGGDEAAAAGVDPSSPGFGIYETRTNLRDPSTGQPIVLLRANRGGKDPPEPVYVIPDPFNHRTIAGGTPDNSWTGVDSGPGIAAVAGATGGGTAQSGSSEPGEAPAESSAGTPGSPPSDTSKAMTLDRAIALAITGDPQARRALLETVRDLRGLPAGVADQVVTDLQANLQRAQETVEEQVAQGGTRGTGSEMTPLDRTISVNRQIIRNQLLKDQGLDPSKEEAAALAVERRMREPGEEGTEPAGEAGAAEPGATEVPPPAETPEPDLIMPAGGQPEGY